VSEQLSSFSTFFCKISRKFPFGKQKWPMMYVRPLDLKKKKTKAPRVSSLLQQLDLDPAIASSVPSHCCACCQWAQQEL